jgi:GNAT superfamily N-acetyltransferase
MPKRAGRKSKAQTPAPPSERIVGSKKNPKGSAASEKSASKIKLNEKTLTALKNKLKEFKEEHPNKSNITLNDLKAVYRRGAGAYSKSHRPTITGGVPNSRNAWSMARVNKFLLKAGGTKVKAAYVQDDDLLKMEEGGDVKTLSIQKRDIGHGKHYIKIQYGSNTIMLTNHDLYIPNEIINRINAPKEKIYQFSTVYVSPSDRGLGIASKLLKATIDYAKEKEIFLVSLIHSQSDSTLNDSELINWLSRNGFSILYTQNKALTYAYFDGSNPDVRFAKGGSTLLAPNGKKSLLTEEQWHLVRTQEFKAWFGDWENDPQNASKVVDENGEPKVVYHGSDNNFSVFDFKTNKGVYSSYSSFTNNKKLAESYGSNIYNVFLKIHNPYIIDGKGDYIWNLVKGKNSPDLFFDELPLNYDGIIFKSVIDFNGKLGTKFVLDISDIYMVRKPSQIKLADGSNTTFDSSNPDIRFENGGSTLLAPNGEPSKLTPEQYKLVRTPEFKAWFGDWENDPQNASKVVDENGEPLVVYHGTDVKFNQFDKSKIGFGSGEENEKNGFYFTSNYSIAKGYADDYTNKGEYGESIVLACFLSIKNALILETIRGGVVQTVVENYDKYDGIIIEKVRDFGGISNQIIAFEPEQIKLADGSNTTFDKNNMDIRYVEGGRVGGFEDLEDEWLSKKIEIFLDKAKPYKFYFVDPKTNSLIVGFDEYVTQEHLEKVYLEATSSKEFFHGNSVEATYNKETGDTIFRIKLRKKVEYYHGGDIYDDRYIDLAPNSLVHKILWDEGYSINVKDRYILSGEKKISFRDKDQEQDTNASKPKGLWYSFGYEWANWVSREMPERANTYEYIHKIDVTKKVLRLETIKQCLEFTDRFGSDASWHRHYLINWDKVAKVYSGIEVTNPRDFHLDEERIGGAKLWWLYGWDVGSGCIWREDGIESIELVYGDEYANGGEINSKDDVNVPLYHGTTKEVWQNSEYETYLYVTDDFEIAKKYALEHEHGNPIVIKIDPNKIKNLKWDVDCDSSDEVCQEVGLITWQDSFNKIGTFAIFGKYDVNDFEIIEITKDYAKGGEVDEKVIKERWAKKKDSLMNMADNIRSLRTNLRKDLKSDNDKDRLTALAISLMDKTAERVGNDESEANGHLGITGLSKRNVKVEGNTITLKYVGKSGVKHEKQFSDEGIANALKDAIANSQSKYVFETSDGFRIKNDRVNRYLNEYDISAKDLRGYSANQWIVSKLREVKDKEILGDEAKRKKKFNEIVKSVAEKVGHGAPTLKKHYMLPSLEREWVNHGRIVDLSNIKRAFKRGGDVGIGSINKGSSVVNNIDYDHLDESQDLPNDGEGVFKKGGEIKFNDTIIYHEEKGNFFVPKNTVYAWLYDDPNARKKLNDGEYDFVLFPPGGGIGLLAQKGYVPPLLKVWRKSYQDKTKGSDKLIGIVKAWYDEENKKLYIDMMTTKRQWRRKGVNSHIIKELREMFNLDKDQIVFDKPTDEGKKFMASGKYAKGGETEKYQENFDELLKNEGWEVNYYDNNVNVVPKEKATNISVFRFEPYYESVSIKLPTKMQVTLEWVMNKVNNDKVYKSFAENFSKILKAKGYEGLNAYPTTYGIGVFVGFGKDIETTKKNVDDLLNSLGIEYSNEYSSAHWVWRYKISKSKENLEKIKNIDSKYDRGGELSDENKKEIYKKWKSLINMSKSELEKFYNSEEGKVAGLTPQQAKSQGIDSGRESARWIMKMKSTSVKDWTPTMWKWAKKQISFVSRMSGNKGPLYDEKGNKTRKHTSLLIWGHNPKKKAQGGEIESQLNNLNMNEVTYNQLPAINDLGVGKKFVLKEHFYGNEGGKPTHRGCRYLIVENMGDAQMADCLKLKVHHAFGGGGVTTRGIITRPIKNIMNKGRDMGESLASGVEKAFKKGGELDPDKKEVKEYFEHKSGAAGGLLVGKRHSEGGIQAINKSTGQPLEMEGGEVVITRDAVSDSTLHDFNGKQMTNREILSAINESGGGVKFADGGDVSCKCSGKEYKLGGKTYKDYELFNKINNGYGSTSAIKKGMEVEDKEHGETFKLLKNGEITYEQFLKKLVVDHLSENPKYYDK